MLDGLNEMPKRRSADGGKVSRDNAGHAFFSQVSDGSAFRTGQDPRERSLRELATLPAIRSRFIISCRTHEFFSSLSWQEVHVLPMSKDQIDYVCTTLKNLCTEEQKV